MTSALSAPALTKSAANLCCASERVQAQGRARAASSGGNLARPLPLSALLVKFADRALESEVNLCLLADRCCWYKLSACTFQVFQVHLLYHVAHLRVLLEEKCHGICRDFAGILNVSTTISWKQAELGKHGVHVALQ